MTTTHAHLPQLGGGLFLTDGGLETELVFLDGIDLPQFAAFPLVTTEVGRHRLVRYYTDYLRTAERVGTGFVLETPTWRASQHWGRALGFDPEDLVEVNRAAVDLMVDLRAGWSGTRPAVISGCVGPRCDAYAVDDVRSPAEYADYHAAQVETFAGTSADLVTALTLTTVEEAIGIATAAARCAVPAVVSFTVETDGRLPSGVPLHEAILATDDATGAYPSYYMVNCAHPTHLEAAWSASGDWIGRLAGFRGNASRLSHAELDEAIELDDGDPIELARGTLALRTRLPRLSVVGGCCGTDHRHVSQMATLLAA